jgi:hypothetical protein
VSVAELNREVLGQLAAGDVVSPHESAKKRVATLVALIEVPYDGARTPGDLREDMLARWCAPSIELLAVLFPVVEYGDERAISVLSRCMLRIASATSLMSEERGWNRQCGVIALGRLVWAVTAYSLHCRRLDALAELSRVSIRLRHGSRPVEPLIGMRELRYPDALDRNAGNSYANYREWLLALDLVSEQYPLFARELEESFDEADLVLAIRAAVEGGRAYSAAVDSKTVRRFADHALDPLCRPGLATTFRTSEDALNDTLEGAFALVETDQSRWDRPRSIFGGDDDQ